MIDIMTVKGKSITTRLGMLDHSLLQFSPENPRVYSIVHESGGEPTQDEIQRELQDMDHVRDLIQDIKAHGGLIDPLVVKDVTYEVVEGNSRLAAYRFLAEKSPVKWSRAKCRVLPKDIDDDLVASLLGQWHLKGKKEWPAYEQAAYLYRRHRKQGTPLTTLAAEAGLGTQRVQKIIEAYELMVAQNDTHRDRWSYYDELVKSRKISAVSEQSPEFRRRVLSMVKRGQFARAQDVRDKLPLICASPRVTARFAAGKINFDEAIEAAKESGGADSRFQKLNKFRLWLAEQEVQDDLVDANGQLGSKVDFELRKIVSLASAVLKKR